eukprot:TRINITY_DN7169_c0_g1_i1.p1 TRINITY_DN7169_c0_g1~~TRINITY_DN7169_c0_g1_i1.p1  ORF type:complete len:586 (+),score=125.55 TRINITY_DN7169_c0_g1_i1:289-2046(+)
MSHRGRPRSRLFPGNRSSLHSLDFEAMRSELQLKMEEEDIFQTEEEAAAAAANGDDQGDMPTLEERQQEALTELEHMIPAEDMAQQMTLMDMEAFKAIQPTELSNGAWMKSDKHTRAPNVLKMTRRFNNVSYWVARTVLFGPDDTRVNRLAHCIKIAKKLHEYNNLHGLLAVISGLHMTPIYRLNKTWQSLKDKYTDRFEKLEDFMSEDDNYSVVRRHLESTKLPCIPYLGMFLTDLAHSKTAAKSAADSAHAHDEQGAILARIVEFQSTDYTFPALGFVQDYLKTIDYDDSQLTEMDSKHYTQSLKIEPRRKSDESLERTEPPFRAMNSRLTSAMKQLKNGSLPFRAKAGGKGHRKTRSLGNPISFLGMGHDDPPKTGEENSLASADGSFLLDDQDDDEGPEVSAEDQAFQPADALNGSLFSTSTNTSVSMGFENSFKPDGFSSDSDDGDLFPVDAQADAARELSNEEEAHQFGSIVREGVLKRKPNKRFRNYRHYWVKLRQRGVLLYPHRAKMKGKYTRAAFRHQATTILDLNEATMAVALDASSKHHAFHLVFDEQIIKFQAPADVCEEWKNAFTNVSQKKA